MKVISPSHGATIRTRGHCHSSQHNNTNVRLYVFLEHNLNISHVPACYQVKTPSQYSYEIHRKVRGSSGTHSNKV